MHLEAFGLAANPFGIAPGLNFLYRSRAFEESIAHLVYGLDSAEALVMITGPIGTGKTMAVQSFLEHLGNRFATALITNTAVDAKELLKLILDDLHVAVPPGADKSDLLILFKQFVLDLGHDGRRLVVVIDEAQNLARDVLEEIRLLTNLGQGAQQPVQVVLVGQPELERIVSRPDLAQLRQRIRVHYQLAPLSRGELEEYVDHRMTVAGGSAGSFTNSALDRVYELSGGVPRVVNSICGDALLSAFVAGRKRIDRDDIEPAGLAAVESDAPRNSPMPRAEETVMAVPRRAPAPATEAGGDDGAPRRRGGGTEDRRAIRPAKVVASRRRRWGVVTTVLLALIAVLAVAAGTGLLPALTGREQVRRPAALDPSRVAKTAPEPAAPTSGDAGGVADAQIAAQPDDAEVQVAGQPEDSATARPAATGNTEVWAPAEADTRSPQAAIRDAPPEAAAEAPGDWFIHVSSFRTSGQAQAVVSGFIAGGQAALVREQQVREALWHRVYLGPFASHDAAVHQANVYRDAGRITYYKVLQLAAEAGS